MNKATAGIGRDFLDGGSGGRGIDGERGNLDSLFGPQSERFSAGGQNLEVRQTVRSFPRSPAAPSTCSQLSITSNKGSFATRHGGVR